MIGIIGAMENEVKMLKSLMIDVSTQCISGINFYVGLLKGKKCVVAQSGIGKVSSAVCTQTMILIYNPRYIINVGVAGGILDNMKIGDIAVASSVVQYDINTTAIGDPMGFISGLNIINIPCCDLLTKATMSISKEFKDINFYEGIIATGDKFLNSKTETDKIKHLFNAIACEMEGASIGQVCYMNNVNFTVIRSISDSADDNSHLDYSNFVNSAAEVSNKIILKLLDVI